MTKTDVDVETEISSGKGGARGDGDGKEGLGIINGLRHLLIALKYLSEHYLKARLVSVTLPLLCLCQLCVFGFTPRN